MHLAVRLGLFLVATGVHYFATADIISTRVGVNEEVVVSPITTPVTVPERERRVEVFFEVSSMSTRNLLLSRK